MTTITYREAVRTGMREALTADQRVFLMGEDVGRYGGAYACSKGFLEEFGPDRIRDAPLSESAFVGAGIGAAIGGLRPIVEVMTVNFSLLALDQIVNNAAAMRHMSGGQVSVPLVIRMATGAGRQVAAQHSHSLEVWYAHVPGIKVLAPATVDDARHMLAAALADPDPVVIFEHAMLYPTEGEHAEDARPCDPWRAVVRRPGRDVALVTMVVRSPRRSRQPMNSHARASTSRCSTCGRSGRSMWRRSSGRSPRRTARRSSTRAGEPAASRPRSRRS